MLSTRPGKNSCWQSKQQNSPQSAKLEKRPYTVPEANHNHRAAQETREKKAGAYVAGQSTLCPVIVATLVIG